MLICYNKIMKKNNLIIYTDGASRGNPGNAGWGAILMTEERVIELAGYSKLATNNQMELLAVQKSLEYANKNFSKYNIFIHSDSAYVINGITSWIYGWQKNNWITSTKKAVENKEYWQKIFSLKESFQSIDFIKVAGHSGHIFNDRCDELAVAYALGNKIKLYDGKRVGYEDTLNQITPSKTKTKTNSKKVYAYISLVDGKIYSDKTWEVCEKRVKGKSGAKYKKVFSKDEETKLIQDFTLDTLF